MALMWALSRLLCRDALFLLALADHAVDHRHGRAVGRGRRVLVAGADRLDHLLDVRAHLAALRGVALPMILGLAGALAGLS